MPRPDDLYLEDILVATGHIDQFMNGVSKDDFMSSELIKSAVLQKLMVIGKHVLEIFGEPGRVLETMPSMPTSRSNGRWCG